MSKIKSLFKRNKLLRFIYSNYIERRYSSLYKKKPHLAANAEYRAVFHKDINWDNPTNLIEKIIWMQFNTDTSLWTRCADKYRVREYIEEKGYGEYLPRLYGHWDRAEDIDFGSLPNQFVLKANNGCGTVLVVKDKNLINIKKTEAMVSKWLKKPFGYMGAQMHYMRIKPCIIAEELLHNDFEDISPNSMIDFKVWCINGVPESILVVYDRRNDTYCLDLYDLKWNRKVDCLFFNGHYEFRQSLLQKPKCLDLMLTIATNISKSFSEVRIDFYVVSGRPVVGELTFTTGFGYFTNSYYDYLGSKINLNNLK